MFTNREIRDVLSGLLEKDVEAAVITLTEMQSAGHIKSFQTFNKNSFLDKIVVFMDGVKVTLEKNG